MTPEDLPLLGEPLPIELANTRYGVDTEPFDFIGTLPLAEMWLEATVSSPPTLSSADHRRLVHLRDAVHSVVRAACTHSVPPAEAVHEVNRCADLAQGAVTLHFSSYPPTQSKQSSGLPVHRLLRQLATETISLVAQPDGKPIHECAAPDCTMFFVKDHHRRRWCHPSCGHRTRQSEYMQRKHGNIA